MSEPASRGLRPAQVQLFRRPVGVIRTLKEQWVHRHRFQTIQHASRVIGGWIRFYNGRRPRQALGMKTQPGHTL
jgi:hypothetical protein